MAKITTRHPDVEESIAEFIQHIIAEVGGPMPADVTDIDSMLATVRQMLHALVDESLKQAEARVLVQTELMIVKYKLSEANKIIESVTDVSYDEALDHATMDMMDVITSAGLAEITDEGDLRFDSSVVATKGDLKPALREAIARWVQLKVQ